MFTKIERYWIERVQGIRLNNKWNKYGLTINSQYTVYEYTYRVKYSKVISIPWSYVYQIVIALVY